MDIKIVNVRGFPLKIKWLHKQREERSVEVLVNHHPLNLHRDQILSLDDVCSGKECYINIGHTAPGIYGHCFVVYGNFFISGVPFVGERTTLDEAFNMMVASVEPYLKTLENAPENGSVVQ